MKLLVICGTDRPNARSRIIAKNIYEILSRELKQDVGFLDLMDIPLLNPGESIYDSETFSDKFTEAQDELLIPAHKIILVSPEYNGAFPGILKVFIDKVSKRKFKESLHFKKALLIGVADGRAGNLRGMDYLTGILNHMKVIVYPIKQPISQVSQFIDEEKETISSEPLKNTLHKLLHDFIES